MLCDTCSLQVINIHLPFARGESKSSLHVSHKGVNNWKTFSNNFFNQIETMCKAHNMNTVDTSGLIRSLKHAFMCVAPFEIIASTFAKSIPNKVSVRSKAPPTVA